MQLGPYEVLGELGRGGMGTVFRARHVAAGVERAVKVLTGVPDVETLDRFTREAQALARLEGRGVVSVHESGTDNRRLWFAMELMPGGSLRARLDAKGPLEWREATRLTAKLARTLARCHELALVHRDVKPGNILFDESGEPRLADFGCVRDLGASTLTQTGSTVGTTPYMAPEQLRGERVGAPTDVFALGILLHEAVTGERPWAGSPIQILRAMEAGPPAPAARVAGSPPALDRAIGHATAFDPARRPTAADLADELEALAAGASWKGAPRGVGGGLARVGLATAGIAGLLGASLLAALLLGRASLPPPPPRIPPAHPSSGPTIDPVPGLERNANEAVTKLLAALAKEDWSNLDSLERSVRWALRDLEGKSPEACRRACRELARAEWPLARERRLGFRAAAKETQEAAILSAVLDVGAGAAAVEAMRSVGFRDGRLGGAGGRKYEDARDAVAPIESLASSALELYAVDDRYGGLSRPLDDEGARRASDLHERLGRLVTFLDGLAVSDPQDNQFRKVTLRYTHVALLDLERLLFGADDSSASRLDSAIGHLEAVVAAEDPVKIAADLGALAAAHFQRAEALSGGRGDAGPDLVAIRTIVADRRFEPFHRLVEARLLDRGATTADERRAARDIAASETTSSLDDPRIQAFGLRAFFAIEDGDAASAEESLRSLEALLESTRSGTVRTFFWGSTLAKLEDAYKAKFPK